MIACTFTEVSECCWTHFLQTLRGTEQRRLKTDSVSLQFYFITALNSHSTSVRHHTLVTERINSLIKIRLSTLCFASHPSSAAGTWNTPQLALQKPMPAVPRSRATLPARAGGGQECWHWHGCHRVYLALISLSLLQTRNAGNENLFNLGEPRPLQGAERGLCRYMKEALRRRSHSKEAEREPPAVSGYLLLAWKGGGRRERFQDKRKTSFLRFTVQPRNKSSPSLS